MGSNFFSKMQVGLGACVSKVFRNNCFPFIEFCVIARCKLALWPVWQRCFGTLNPFSPNFVTLFCTIQAGFAAGVRMFQDSCYPFISVCLIIFARYLVSSMTK